MVRKVVFTILFGLLWAIPAAAGTTTFLQAASDTSDATTYTWAAQNCGTVSADRYIVVTFTARKSIAAATTATAATVCGVGATIVVQRARSAAATNIVVIAIAAVPSGTTGTNSVTFDQTMSRAGYGAYAITGLNSATATDTDSAITADPSVSLTVPNNGFAIGVAGSGGNSTTTWTNLTERYDTTIEAATLAHTGASADFVSGSTPTLTATFSGADNEDVGAFASWAYVSASTAGRGTLLGVGP
jgi:hypothetical protein